LNAICGTVTGIVSSVITNLILNKTITANSLIKAGILGFAHGGFIGAVGGKK
jgi:hypothetical protein